MVSKGETVVLRISPDDKATIKGAADSVGQSVTTFITAAALKSAQKIAKRPPSRGVHGGVPTFFKASCFEAAHGGANGYATPGWHLSAGLGSQVPDDIELDEWANEVESLKQLLDEEDDEEVWSWFKRHYPKCTALIPTRRRDQFVSGVRRAYEEGRIEV